MKAYGHVTAERTLFALVANATCSMSTAMNEIQLNLARKWRAQYFDQIIGQDIVG